MPVKVSMKVVKFVKLIGNTCRVVVPTPKTKAFIRHVYDDGSVLLVPLVPTKEEPKPNDLIVISSKTETLANINDLPDSTGGHA